MLIYHLYLTNLPSFVAVKVHDLSVTVSFLIVALYESGTRKDFIKSVTK